MGKISHIDTHLIFGGRFLSNITDMMVVETATGLRLVTANHMDGGIAAYQLGDGLRGGGTRLYPAGQAMISAPQIDMIKVGGRDMLVSYGADGALSQGLDISRTSGMPQFGPLFSAGGLPRDVVALDSFSAGGQDYLIAGRAKSLEVELYRLGGDGSVAAHGKIALALPETETGAQIDLFDTISHGGKTFVIAGSSMGNGLALFRVSADGSMEQRSLIGPDNTIGLTAPRDVAMVQSADKTFAIVSGGGSSSLSVFEIEDDRLVLRDHVIDGGVTRFQRVTALDAVEIDGRVFIVAGGADDGISVLTLDPTGRLILLDSFADTGATAMAKVSALAVAAIDGKLAIFVASGSERGVTELRFDPGPIGRTEVAGSGIHHGGDGNDIIVAGEGTTHLIGGKGDDIMIARGGDVQLTGGAGADRFVPHHSSGRVIITDFQPGLDILDLSELGFARSVMQLNIVPTAKGALLTAGPVTIEIRTADGISLPQSFFTNEMFGLPHYANDIDFSRLIQPVNPINVPPRPPAPQPAPEGEEPDWPRLSPDAGPRPSMPAIPPPPPAPSDTRTADSRGSALVANYKGSRLIGQEGNDTLRGSDAHDVLEGGGGNDQLYGRGGDDILIGGAGNDMLLGEAGDDFLDGGDGHDRLFGGIGNDSLFGGDGNDLLMGEHGDDYLVGGAGDDTLSGGQGNNTLLGGAGNDRMVAGAGNDVMIDLEGNNFFNGGDGDDWIEAGDGDDVIIGWSGNDTIFVSGGNNSIWGAAGDDLIFGGSGPDRIMGGPGEDTIIGGAGDDSISGGPGHDYIEGGPGNDMILGADGNDTLFGDDGDDLIFGGFGDDLIIGGDGNDTLFGEEGDDTIMGGDGRDVLRGGAGNDLLYGGGDNDWLYGGSGDDTLYGGDGNDFLTGEAGNDVIHGGAGNDRIHGGAGNDLLFGDAGNDRIYGNDGDDTLDGGAGDDIMSGGVGDDLLIGGPGRDTMTGGAGRDVFLYRHESESPRGAHDTITDFRPREDRLDLSALGGGLVVTGASEFSRQPGEIIQRKHERGTMLEIDFDGDGLADMAVFFQNGAVLDAGDFIL